MPDQCFKNSSGALRYVAETPGPLDVFNQYGEHVLSKGAEKRPEPS